MYNDVHDLEVK